MAQFIKDTLQTIPGVDPRIPQRSQAFSGLNDGPAATAARLAGLVQKEKALDDSPYYTGNFGQVMHHPGYPLNIGGIPYQGDTLLLEKQQAFNRGKMQERIVHPAGWGGFAQFTVTQDVSHLTKAAMFQPGKKTPAFVRLSTVTFGKEFPDEGRNPRGFAVKFYTEDGNYDIVGLNWPIFFVRDPFQGPDNIRSQQRDPRSNLIDFNGWFDFLGQVPESNHAGLMLLSDYGTPAANAFNAYGCHTFRWVNAEGKSVFIKYQWQSDRPSKQYTFEEATEISGIDPDHSKRELFEGIEAGKEFKWTMFVQIMTPEEAAQVDFDPFDVTKVWPRGQFPMHEVGVLNLNRNPEDYHREVEQVAFSPGSLVPGVELSPDTLLQWRAFFYRDAQLARFGTANIHQVPVNCPFMSKFHSPDNFDGVMRTDGNSMGKPKYFPNAYMSTSASTNSTPGFNPHTAEAPYQVANNVVSRQSYWRHEGETSEYNQVRELYTRVMNDAQRANLHKNTAKLLKFADLIVVKNYLIQIYAISPDYANGIHVLLPEDKQVDMSEVAEKSKTAHLVNKNPDFISKNKASSFMGMPFPRST